MITALTSSLTRPRLRPELTITESTAVGKTIHIVKDPRTEKFYQFRPAEYRLLSLMNGERTWDEMAEVYRERFSQQLSAKSIGQFIDYVSRIHLLEKTATEKNLIAYEKARAFRKQRWARLGGAGSILYRRWRLFDPDAFMDKAMERIGFLWTPAAVKIGLLFVACAAVLGIWHGDQLSADLAAIFDFENLSALALLGFWILSVIITIMHEFGHGLTCKRFGGEVHDIGLFLIFFQPTMYCNVSDAWLFKSRARKIYVTFAGVYVELIVASIAMFGWWMTKEHTLLNQFFLASAAVSSVSSLAFNFNPLIKLDGYLALIDYIEFPNLYEESREYVKALFKRIVTGLPIPLPQTTPHRRRIMITYGSLSLLYSKMLIIFIAIFFGIFIVDKWGTTGWLLVLASVGWWLKRTISKLRAAYQQWRKAHPVSVRRLNRRIFWTAVVLVLFLGWPTAHRLHLPCTAVPDSLYCKIAEQNAVVSEVFIRSGEHVAAGDLLMVLTSDSLTAEAEIAGIGLAAAVDPRALTAGPRSDSVRSDLWAQIKRHRSRTALANAGRERLILASPGDGIIMNPDPYFLTGRAVAPGDTLCLIGQGMLVAKTGVLQDDLDRVKIGYPAAVVWKSSPANRYIGTISHIAEVPDQDGYFTVRVSFSSLGEHWILGSTGEATFIGRRVPIGWHLLTEIYRSFRGGIWWDLWPF